MEIKVAKQDLEAALGVVASCQGSGADITSHFLFRLNPEDKSKAEVLAYGSGRLCGVCPIVGVQVSDSTHEAFTIEGKRLKMWLDKLPQSAITFSFDGTVVTTTVPGRGSQKFRSLNPDDWSYWDQTLKDAKHTATLPADRLATALEHASKFASDNESRSPDLCVCEVVGGTLTATDQIAATLVEVKGLEESTMRIHAKDVSNINGFLSTIKGDVEVFEHDRMTFFKRIDGAVYGETRMHVNFPSFGRPKDHDEHRWELSVEDLNNALPFLAAGASWEDHRLRIQRFDSEDRVVVAMTNATGSVTELDVGCFNVESDEGASPLPDDGFVLPQYSLARLLSLHDGEKIRIGLNTRPPKGGYVRILDTKFADDDGENGDEYLTIMAWLR